MSELLFHANEFRFSFKDYHVSVKQEYNTNKLYLKYFNNKNGIEIKSIKPNNKLIIESLVKKVETIAKKRNLIVWSY